MTDKIIYEINRIVKEKGRCIVAVDGRCGSGKSTLARELSKKLSCFVFHMDDFFLRPEQRTAARLLTPGENVDHERFLTEVLLPLSEGKSVYYKPYSCSEQKFKDGIMVMSGPVFIVEGSYSCNKNLLQYYDLKIFLDVDYNEQITRLTAREGTEKLAAFQAKWIPLEEEYFKTFGIKEKCDLYFKS